MVCAFVVSAETGPGFGHRRQHHAICASIWRRRTTRAGRLMHYDHWLEGLLSSRLFGGGSPRYRPGGSRVANGQRLTPQRGRDGLRRECVVVVCMPNDLLIDFLLRVWNISSPLTLEALGCALAWMKGLKVGLCRSCCPKYADLLFA